VRASSDAARTSVAAPAKASNPISNFFTRTLLRSGALSPRRAVNISL
jgi:hypothetical protein